MNSPPHPTPVSPRNPRIASVDVRVSYLALVLLLAQSASAINITMQLQQEGMNPSDDPNGTRLLAIADAAAKFWEDALPEPGNYEIDIWWDDEEISGIQWGLWTQDNGGDNNIRINPNPLDQNFAGLQWFFDPTPTNHSEFDFMTQNRTQPPGNPQFTYNGGQWLYRDLQPAEQFAGFGGNPPDVMEVGFRGRATNAAFLVQADLLSTVVHEIGHELGVNGSGGPWVADPAWLPGGSAIFYENANEDHLFARSTLMCGGCGLPGTRRLPSAVDIMAAADDEEFSVLDLPRQDYIGSGEWHTLMHWTGPFIPEADDRAFLRDNNVVLLTGDAEVESLTISNGSTLIVQSGNTLTVAEVNSIYNGIAGEGLATISGGGKLNVHGNGVVNVDALTINNGNLTVNPGAAVNVVDDLLITTDGVGPEISAYGGTITIGGQVVNEGEITAFASSTTFDYTGVFANNYDLDGVGELGTVSALTGDLVFNGGLTDAFDSLMLVADGQSITMNHEWTLGGSGTLRLDGATGNPAVLSGPSTMNVDGTVDSDVGVLSPDLVRFTQSAVVNVSHAGDRLTLATNAILSGGSYTGDGAIEQQGDVQVHADVAIETAEYDWGNSTASEAHDTNIQGNFTFEINSATTGTPRNEYRGTINVIGGTLAVNTDSGWLLPRRNGAGDPAGTLVFNAGDVNPPELTGMPLTVEGYVRAEAGPSIVKADFITTPSADVHAMLAAKLDLNEAITYDGGTIHGDGEIIQSGNATVVSNTAINTKYYDLDGDEAGPSTTTVDPGVLFTINSDRIDQPGQSYHGTLINNGGTLTVNTPTAWTIGSGGTLQLVNNNGPAWVDGAHLNVSGHVSTSGGNEIFAPVTFGNTASVAALQSGDILRLRDHTNYEGGAYQGQGGIIQDATAFVNAPTTMDLGFFDMDGTTESNFIELHDDLTLNVGSIDMSDDNQFDGVMEVTQPARLTVNTPSRWRMNGVMNVAGAPGTVVTVAGAEMKLLSSVSVLADNVLQFEADVSGAGSFVGGGEVVFLGEYNPGNSPALVSIEGDVRFGDAAALAIEIGGREPGLHYDSLVIDGVAELAGALDITLINVADSGQTFVPELGNHFNLIEATGGLTGAFDDVNLPWAGPGLGWDIGYVDGVIQMKVIESRLSTDADYDEDVDGFDFLAIQRHGGSHISKWEQEFGVRPESDAAKSAVPEPATCAMLVLAAAMYAMNRKEKTRLL